MSAKLNCRLHALAGMDAGADAAEGGFERSEAADWGEFRQRLDQLEILRAVACQSRLAEMNRHARRRRPGR